MNCLTNQIPAADSATELEEAVDGLRTALERWVRSLNTIHAERNLLRHRLGVILHTVGKYGLCPACQTEVFWMPIGEGTQVAFERDGQGHFHAGVVS